MQLSKYVAKIIADQKYPTESSLTIDGTLLYDFQRIRDYSEQEILECGAALHWVPPVGTMSGRLSMGATIIGERTSVLWNPGEMMDPAYIGTFHTHPYKKKLATEAAVGFSIGDFVFYAENHPMGRPGVHVVVSGHRLFLLIYRHITRRTISDAEKHAFETDENESEQYFQQVTGMNPTQYQNAYMDMEIDRQGKNANESGRIEREFYEQAPGYTQFRMDANKKMIVRTANTLKAELYMSSHRQDSPMGVVSLKSAQVCFGHGAVASFQRTLKANGVAYQR